MTRRFTVIYHPRAKKDYQKLDGSQRKLVLAGVERLRRRADEIGKHLHGGLAGCRALKWRRSGLRLVYRIGPEGLVEIVEIVANGKRAESEVYAEAASRLNL